MLFCDHVVSLEDFKILASSNSEFHLKIKESLLTWIKQEREVSATLLIWLMYSCSNTLFAQGLNIITVVSLFHCNFWVLSVAVWSSEL